MCSSGTGVVGTGAEKQFTAFAGTRCIGAGVLSEVAAKAKIAVEDNEHPVFIFDDDTAQILEIDLRGTAQEVLGRLEQTITRSSLLLPGESEAGASRGPGRPKLGVVAREVTLLPRHWDWLSSQPGGASVALRKLVDEARKSNANRDAVRKSREVAYRFMSALAGNLPGFEEAARALFAGNKERFEELLGVWPADIGDYAKKLAARSFRQADQ